MLVVKKLKRGLATLIMICFFLPLCLKSCSSEDLIPAEETYDNFYSYIHKGDVKGEGVIPSKAEVVSFSAGDLFEISIFPLIFFWPLFFQIIAAKTRTRRTYIFLNLTETILSIGSLAFLLVISTTIFGGIRYGGILALSSYTLYFWLSVWLTISYFRSNKSLVQHSSGTTKQFATVFFTIALASTLGCAYILRSYGLLQSDGFSATHVQEGTGEYIDDNILTSKVKSAILGDPSLKSAEINVETFKGVVQLSGFVSSAAVEDKAVEVARSVKGVKSVKDDMRLK